MNCAHLPHFCHHCSEPPGCLKGGKFVGKLSDYEGVCCASYWRQTNAHTTHVVVDKMPEHLL
jgi:hypothetical protein